MLKQISDGGDNQQDYLPLFLWRGVLLVKKREIVIKFSVIDMYFYK